MKRIARYLLNRERVVWVYESQDEPSCSHLASDGDWGGNSVSGKSTSGGFGCWGSTASKPGVLLKGHLL